MTKWNPPGVCAMVLCGVQAVFIALKVGGTIGSWSVALCPMWFVLGMGAYAALLAVLTWMSER